MEDDMMNIKELAEELLQEDEEDSTEEEFEALDDDGLVSLINTEVNLIETDAWDVLAQQRIASTLQFEHVLNNDTKATEGLSNVVMNFTSPSVETLSTYMTKIFCSDKQTVDFTATSPQKREAAEQAMMMVNEVIHKYNPGYKVLSQCFKDAAINKNSIIKVTWDESETAYEEDYANLPPEQLDAIIMQKEQMGYEVEVVKEESTTEITMVPQPDPLTGEMVDVEVENTTSEVTLRCVHKKGMPKIENVPPEEFLINEGAFAINDDHRTRFVAQRKLIYKSDVMAMFPGVDVSDLSAHSTAYDFDWEQQARHIFDGTYDSFQNENGEEATRQYEVMESWIRADRNGDGMAEWRHTFSCGSTLLMDEEWFGPIPFSSFCYFPITHKFYGLSVYDKLRDYERSATALLRSEVDSSVMRNTNRFIADPRFINHRDLQTVKNGVVRAMPGFNPQHVMAIPTAAGGSNSTALLDIIRQQVIAEIGIDPISGQISTDVEKSGNDATKTSMVIDNASSKIESYAREFADSTFRDVVWQVIKLLVAHNDDPSVLALTDSVTPGQPFILGQMGMQNALNKSDLTAKVGLGHQTGQQKVAAAQSLVQMVQAFSADPTSPLPIPPLAKLELAYEMARGWGYDNPEKLFGTKKEVSMGAQQAETQKQQAMQMQQQQLQMQQQQAQMQGQQIQHQMQLAQQESLFRQQLETAQHEADLKTKSVDAEKTLADTEKSMAEAGRINLESQLAQTNGIKDINVNL